MWQNNGFIKDDTIDVPVAMQELAALMVYVRKQYEALPGAELLRHPAKGKWSKKQVLGHLIDSAINNLKRFSDAQVVEQPYNIISYQQDGLMAVNNYQQLPLQHLLGLWQLLNQQIIFVVERMPTEKLQYQVQTQYNHTGTQTLAWLICDYVAHLQHHLQHIAL